MKNYLLIKRVNDRNGNPFRLIILIENGIIGKVYESRFSSPNIIHHLHKQGYQELIEVLVSPSEYKRLKGQLKVIRED